jgi:hypothetical protein
MSTYSTNLAIELIGTGEQAGAWGTTTNTNLGTLIEQAISGYVTQAITDGADTVITIPNAASGVARNMSIECTGALTAARNLIVPANRKLYFIYNNTTGNFAVTVKVSGQTGVSVPNGKKMVLVSNGTDIVVATNHMATLTLGAALPVASGGSGVGTLTGVAFGNGTSAFTAATEAQITTAIGTTAVTNATNATNASNAYITQDVASATAQFINFTSISTGNAGIKAAGSELTYTPSTKVLAVNSVPVVTTTGTQTLTNKTIQGGTITSATRIITSSGTSHDFTSIPSWVKRITVLVREMGTSGSSSPIIQIGSSGVPTTTGYVSNTSVIGNGPTATAASTTGFFLTPTGYYSPAWGFSGSMTICLISPTVWVASGLFGVNGASNTTTVGGYLNISGTLDIVRLTTANGTDVFSSGEINIFYE